MPDSDWVAPTSLPDLRDRPWIALDTETKDDSLAAERGPGWPYRAGYICGLGWHSSCGSEGYAPIAHPDTACLDKSLVARWLQDHVDAGVRLVFQNAPYDMGWFLADLGVEIPIGHPIEDALAMDFMLDENHLTYNLGDICKRLGIPGKDEKELWEAAAVYLDPGQAARGQRSKKFVLTNKIVKSNIWRLPARYVGRYGTNDPRQTAAAVELLRPGLAAQSVEAAYRLEMDLVPVVMRMRARGMRVDVEATQRDVVVFRKKRDAILKEIASRLGTRAISIDDLRTNKWLEPTFGNEGIRFPSTEKTQVGSFTKDWMEKHPHWLPKLVVRAEQYDAMSEKFLSEYILSFSHRGRLHSEIHQYKSDDGGTVSYRFSMSQPPLQQSPSPDIDKELGLAFRDKVVADEGEEFSANDYSQQEYRLTAHFAAVVGVRGGEEAVQAYRINPSLDYHQFVADCCGLPRSRAKIQNFAILYGEGLRATAAKLGISIEEAQALRRKIEEKAPFGPALDDYVKRRAAARGYVRLIDGARCRFDQWEAGWLSKEERDRGFREHRPMGPCSLEEARRRRADEAHPWHGVRLKRAFVHKSMNRLIQGSAARMTKAAVLACARAGMVPILQMHDEMCFSSPVGERVGERAAEIMRAVLPLRVPMKVDAGVGSSWATAKSKG